MRHNVTRYTRVTDRKVTFNLEEEKGEDDKETKKTETKKRMLTQLLNPNIQMFLGLKKFLKQTIRKTVVTTPKKMIVKTLRKN